MSEIKETELEELMLSDLPLNTMGQMELEYNARRHSSKTSAMGQSARESTDSAVDHCFSNLNSIAGINPRFAVNVSQLLDKFESSCYPNWKEAEEVEFPM